MAWNYRVVKFDNGEDLEPSYEVSEVYYDDKGVPHSWSRGHHVLSGETLEELHETASLINDALKKPTLYVPQSEDSITEIDETIENTKEEERP